LLEYELIEWFMNLGKLGVSLKKVVVKVYSIFLLYMADKVKRLFEGV
jgi:hypothetical protein